jgi:hypothetical protein
VVGVTFRGHLVALSLEGDVSVVVVLIFAAGTVVIVMGEGIRSLHGIWDGRQLILVVAALVAIVARRSGSLATERIVQGRRRGASMCREVGRITETHQLASNILI